MSKTNSELEAKILKNPDDEEAYVVYGDWLQSEGDPRGELIALMHRSADEEEVSDFVREHQDELLGELAGMVFEDEDPPLAIRWRLGFIESAKVKLNFDQYDSGDYEPEQMIETLMQHPSARFLRELRLGILNHEGENAYDGAIEKLAELGPRPTMKSIYIGDFEFPDETEMSWSETGDTSPLWKLYRNLETVTVQSGDIDLGEIDLPKVRSFTVKSGGLGLGPIESICRAKWPELLRLEVWFGDRNYQAQGTVDAIALILEGTGLGKLRHLGLMNAEFTDELCRAIPNAKILRQLESLDLSMGTMSDDGARVLREHQGKLAHLSRLNLEHNYLTEKGEEVLRGICKEVHFGEQQSSRGSERRYMMVGE